MAETSAEVRRDIELTRNRISDTLQELEQKMNVAQIVKNNPWPALAVAVGAGVLLRGTKADVKAAAATVVATRGASSRLGGVLLLLGTLATFTGIVLLIGDQWLPRDLYWVAALLFAFITGGVAAWLANRGRILLSPAALAPRETVASLKEDREWLKHPLKSGVTSN